ncbi:recombination mediator RecR [Candidatus Haliotispira prima]|uniref:Recombination protein RecR n=1 Tax=Candidatus Haliotispira prima TaxID=3034016 RepID=A0ABY8MHX0_9SPIO|nr:recombination mediator RecR [Candidatus Haliotispira prima]
MNPLDPLIRQFSGLPGIGRKSAARIVFHILNSGPELAQHLGQSLQELHEQIQHCPNCGNYMEVTRETETENQFCTVCLNPQRNPEKLCIVENIRDLYTIEGAQTFDGYYQVLHGTLSPIDGIGPEQLGIHRLLERIRNQGFREVILATNPTLEGDATAIYIKQQLAALQTNGGPLAVSRIASGLPVGGDLEYADRLSVARALESRYRL